MYSTNFSVIIGKWGGAEYQLSKMEVCISDRMIVKTSCYEIRNEDYKYSLDIHWGGWGVEFNVWQEQDTHCLQNSRGLHMRILQIIKFDPKYGIYGKCFRTLRCISIHSMRLLLVLFKWFLFCHNYSIDGSFEWIWMFIAWLGLALTD